MMILLLTLMITLIILKSLSLFHCSINATNVKNMKTRQTKSIKKYRRRINASNMAFNKSAGLVYVYYTSVAYKMRVIAHV